MAVESLSPLMDMMKTVQVRCRNNGQKLLLPAGSSLKEAYAAFGIEMKYGPICAKVNNKVEGMNYRFFRAKTIEFLDVQSPSGRRNYSRTLFFVLCKAVHDLYRGVKVRIDTPVSNGYYVDLNLGRPVEEEDVERIRHRMQEIIDAAIPIHRYEMPTEEVINMFETKGDMSKVKLLKSIGRLYSTYYQLDDYVDYYYGALLTNTSQLWLFGLVKYYDGLLLRIPSSDDPSQLGEVIRQDKMFEVFQEHHNRQKILEMNTVGDFNAALDKYSNNIIQISEALQEKKFAEIAMCIAVRVKPELVPEKYHSAADKRKVRMVLIAGPSSSGKTTTCKRISVQLVTNGIKPVPISLDDYFVDRENTPRDASGDYDYESLYALNLPLLNQHLQALFNGEEIELPKYNFAKGRSEPSGKRLRLHDDEVLIVEGIHALNPELTAQIPEEYKFRVYASALTTILLDDHNYIPTTDNRLIRRIVRDHKYRGCSAQETIRRWPSVRRGEQKWIFPYQENADIMFNTAMLYELAVLKIQAGPLLEQVPENCDEYSEAYRLLKFLKIFKPLPYDDLPPTSILREFLGGSSFKY